MNESQNIEWKENWKDDHLKWICSFANASGGKLYIGKNDNGEIVGIDNYEQLMTHIPNKIKDLLGIFADVNLLDKQKKYYIEIITPPYSTPISLRGKYYYRSGSTTSELTGNALNEFLLKKFGLTWDEVEEERAGIEDIDEASINKFLSDAKNTDRLPDIESLSLTELLEKLKLIKNNKLKRAAIILFGKSPNDFYPNLKIKIGKFGESDSDLKFQEVIEGNLINAIDSIIETLNHKFLVRPIEYKGIQRIEKQEYPYVALREMILNSLIHRLLQGANIQIRVYDNKISIWNEGTLPEGINFENLKGHHTSIPRNPLIADICFKGGYIESWGRGTLKIYESCQEANLPEPEIIDFSGGIMVVIKKHYSAKELETLGLNKRQIIAMKEIIEKKTITNTEYQEKTNSSKATATRDLSELVEKNLLTKEGTTGVGTIYLLGNT